MSCEIDTWNAHVHESDGKRTLHVIGEGQCNSSGHALRLVETNEGTPGDPNSIVLALEVDEPDVAAEVITPEKVEGHFEIGDDPATQVVIRGAASATIPIDN
jgi:hypothetical protein